MGIVQFFALTGLFNGLVALVFGILVFFKDKRNIVKQTVGLITLSTAVWGFGYWFWLTSSEHSVALFWSRVLSVGSTLIPLFYFHWIMALLGLHKKKERLIRLFYILTGIFIMLGFTQYFIKDVEPRSVFPFWPVPGLAYHFYLFFSYAVMVVYTGVNIIRSYRSSFGYKKEQLKYIIIASVLGFGGGATNFFLWYKIPILPYGTALVFLYPILFTYAVVKYRLMDIRRLVSKSLIYFVLVLMVAFAFTSITFLTASVFESVTRISKLMVALLVSLIVVLGIDPLKKFLSLWTDKIFFRGKVDYANVLTETSTIIAKEIFLDRLVDSLMKKLSSELKIKKVDIYLSREKSGQLESCNNDACSRIDNKSPLYSYLLTQHGPLVVEELEGRLGDLTEGKSKHKLASLLEQLEEMGAVFVMPIYKEGELAGAIICGEKLSGDVYSDEDINLFEVLAPQLALALDKSSLYEESLAFGRKLKVEVDKATRDLKKANKRLIDLDKLKTEFISVASHQLRTPLSGVKGYLSMLLDGDFGFLSDVQKKVINDLYNNNERLVRLVNVFLNISRIESGRLRLDKKQANFSVLLKSAVNQMVTAAKNKQLTLEYVGSKGKIPKLEIDADKIMDVVLNLIDNAIKYSVQGAIKVKAMVEAKTVRVEVSDEGVGIEKDQLDKLFNKFIRGRGAGKLNTSGSGLGLFIAKKIIEMHGGKIWGESRGKNQGSVFIFELPIKYDSR